MDLINQLVSNLGVSEEQAKGGAGMLFKLAQDKLSGGEFAQITDKVSGLDDMLSAAPDTAEERTANPESCTESWSDDELYENLVNILNENFVVEVEAGLELRSRQHCRSLAKGGNCLVAPITTVS